MNSSPSLKGKKGFDANQVFMYIASLVIVGIVMLVGFSAVSSLQSTSNDIAQIKLTKDIVDAVQQVAREYRSVRSIDISLGSAISKLCIINVVDGNGSNYIQNNIDDCRSMLSVQVCDSWSKMVASPSELSKKNIFFFDTDNQVAYAGYVSGLIPLNSNNAGAVICTEPGLVSTLKFVGLTKKVTVELS